MGYILTNHIANSQAQDRALEQAREAALQGYQANVDGYNAGQSTATDILEAETQVVAAKQALLDHRYQSLITWIRFQGLGHLDLNKPTNLIYTWLKLKPAGFKRSIKLERWN